MFLNTKYSLMALALLGSRAAVVLLNQNYSLLYECYAVILFLFFVSCILVFSPFLRLRLCLCLCFVVVVFRLKTIPVALSNTSVCLNLSVRVQHLTRPISVVTGKHTLKRYTEIKWTPRVSRAIKYKKTREPETTIEFLWRILK